MGEDVNCISGDFPHSQGGKREGFLCVSCDGGPSDSVLEESREFLVEVYATTIVAETEQ